MKWFTKKSHKSQLLHAHTLTYSNILYIRYIEEKKKENSTKIWKHALTSWEKCYFIFVMAVDVGFWMRKWKETTQSILLVCYGYNFLFSTLVLLLLILHLMISSNEKEKAYGWVWRMDKAKITNYISRNKNSHTQNVRCSKLKINSKCNSTISAARTDFILLLYIASCLMTTIVVVCVIRCYLLFVTRAHCQIFMTLL